MIKKEELEKINKLKVECENLEKRLEKLNTITVDSVKGSGKNFPYIQHTCVVEGLNDSKLKRQYKKSLENKKNKIAKIIKKFEYDLNNVKDSEIRQILRYKYEDNLTNYQIAMRMCEDYKNDKYTEDSVRMKINRFFEKNT